MVQRDRKFSAERRAPDYMSPKSTSMQLFLSIVAVSVVVGLCSDSLIWSFDSRVDASPCWWITYICDGMYMLMMLTKMFTAYYQDGVLITNGPMIRKHYLRTTFALDLFSCLPTGLWTFLPGIPDLEEKHQRHQILALRYFAMFRANRLVRLYYFWAHFGK